MKKRVADYIVEKLSEAGARHVFLVTGGMIMHLTDALLQNKDMNYICCHHEQAATMAAEAYGRANNKLGVVFATAGPGTLNTITGVVGAYVDSSPCLIVGGQSKVSQAMVTGPRQFALQGFNNLALMKHITKYAVMLSDLKKVRYEVEKCIYIARQHRVGPVYMECPIDIQGAPFDPEEHAGFVPPSEDVDSAALERQIEQVSDMLSTARRPAILAGAGIRLADAIDDLQRLATTANIPILTSRLGMDLIGDDHPLFVGRPGTYGDRAANFTVQNCDLLLVLGCRLGIGLVGYDYQGFAKNAKKVMVDIDENELHKPSVIPDLPIRCEVGQFLRRLQTKLDGRIGGNQEWVEQTQTWKRNYPVDVPEYAEEKDGINSYHFTRLYSQMMAKDDLFLVDTGSCFHVHAQAFKVKFGQRHIITGGLSTMGYVPAVLGVAAANPGRSVYCITGDGSIQMNLQELQTIVHYRLPVKIILYNNHGYLLIRNTQRNFCEGRLIGESKETGVGFPDMEKIAHAYGIRYIRIARESEIEPQMKMVMAHDGPVICEVMNPREQLLGPRVQSKKLEDGSMISMAYDDMYPYLPRDEYERNCLYNRKEQNSKG